MPSTTGTPYVRSALPSEFAQVVDLGCRALSNDPLLCYFGCINQHSTDNLSLLNNPRQPLRNYLAYLVDACWLIGGRVDVVCLPSKSKDLEQIVAAALWLPPRRRFNAWNWPKLLRAGLLSVTQEIGVEGMMRMAIEYPLASNGSWRRGYQAEEEVGSVDESWFLRCIFTEPKKRNLGMMTMLIRDIYSLAPASVFTLEATTAEARDHFLHLGFELLDRCTLGEKPVNSKIKHCDAENSANGVEIYSMVNWNRKNRSNYKS